MARHTDGKVHVRDRHRKAANGRVHTKSKGKQKAVPRDDAAEEPREKPTYLPSVREHDAKRGERSNELADRGSPVPVERPSKPLARQGVFAKPEHDYEPTNSKPAALRDDAEPVERPRVYFPAYPELRKYQPTLVEAFALDEAFTSDLAHCDFSRIVHEHGKFYVKHDPYGAGGRQYFPQQLHQSLLRMELVTRQIASGQTIVHIKVKGRPNEIIDLANYWHDATDDEEEDEESDAETARDRIFALLKEVQYVYAEEIVKAARAHGSTYTPTEEEVDIARRPQQIFFTNTSVVRILHMCR
ncbi:hypothetical protein LTR08_006659 [Meristemomyces frigidus]|nr:hypothetical protein LTR08_006659 [Meristemomyces frigidus]